MVPSDAKQKQKLNNCPNSVLVQKIAVNTISFFSWRVGVCAGRLPLLPACKGVQIFGEDIYFDAQHQIRCSLFVPLSAPDAVICRIKTSLNLILHHTKYRRIRLSVPLSCASTSTKKTKLFTCDLSELQLSGVQGINFSHRNSGEGACQRSYLNGATTHLQRVALMRSGCISGSSQDAEGKVLQAG